MHEHDHDHDHDRTVNPMVEEITDFEVLEIALRELCIEKGIFTAEEHRRFTEFAEQIGPAPAARLVARAWLDPDFKALALAAPLTASKEVGVDWLEPTGFGTPSDFTAFQILADTPTVHHVIVCALCSCYPRPILGRPPDWYKSFAYRSRAVVEPRAVMREFGTELPPDVTVRVFDSSADMRYLVLPRRPDGSEGMTEDELATLVTRDSMIGVTLAREPARTAAGAR